MRISAPLPNMGSSTPMNYILTLTGICATLITLGWLGHKERSIHKLDHHIETALQAANTHQDWGIHCPTCGWESTLPLTYQEAVHNRDLHNRLHEYDVRQP